MPKRDTTIPALFDYVAPETVGEITYKAENFIGKPLHLMQYEIIQLEGRNNQPYDSARMYCTDPSTGKEITLTSAAKIVVAQLQHMPPDLQLPVYIVFRTQGNNLVIGK